MEMNGLLVPKPAINVAAFDKLGVVPDVVHATPFEDEDCVGRHQSR